MKRVALLLPLVGALLCAHSALATPQGLVQGGYDEATGALEGGFKIMAIKRVFSEDECYPPPNEIVTILRRDLHRDVVVSPNLNSIQGLSLINVIADETTCDRLVLALRAGAKQRIFVLDSNYGPVYLAGHQEQAGKNQVGGSGPLRDLTSASKEFRMREPDGTSRLEVLCPDGAHPMGGGFFNATPLGRDGEGVYSHSYERLGATDGFHDTATLVDPSQKSTATHRVLLQVVCGQGLVPIASPHATTYVHRHESATVTAHCPEGTQIFSGGFQRTNFTTPGVVRYGGHIYGGDYITESRADGTDGWRVSGGATGENGGELTAIAYCGDDSSLPIKEVSTEVSVGDGKAASAVTPTCPQGYALISGGFSFGDSHNALFADGYFTRGGRWAATGYGWFGSADLTAYGYCAKARDTLDRSDFPIEPHPGPAASSGGTSKVIYIVIGAIALLALLLFLRRRQVVRRRRRRVRPRRP
jgi:MYXO-CTERM domain-containing protein